MGRIFVYLNIERKTKRYLLSYVNKGACKNGKKSAGNRPGT